MIIMNKEFVTYEQALALKELGFDEPCFAHYCNGDLITKTAILKSSTMLYYQQNNINPNNQYKHQNCTAPLYQQAFRWFREKYQMVFCYEPCIKKDLTYMFFIYIEVTGEKVFVIESKYDKEAESACLDKLIEIVKNEK